MRFCGDNEPDGSFALFLRFLKESIHLLCNNSAILCFILIVSSHFLTTFSLFYIPVYHKSTNLCFVLELRWKAKLLWVSWKRLQSSQHFTEGKGCKNWWQFSRKKKPWNEDQYRKIDPQSRSLPNYESVVQIYDPKKIEPATPYRFFLLGLDKQTKMTITKLETVSQFNNLMWVNESTLAHDIIR